MVRFMNTLGPGGDGNNPVMENQREEWADSRRSMLKRLVVADAVVEGRDAGSVPIRGGQGVT